MTSPAANSRSEQIAKIAADWWRKRSEGHIISAEAIAAAHPELMPELGQHLRLLQRMNQAERHLQVVSAIVPSENNAASTFTLPERQSLSKATGDPQACDPAQLGVRLDQRYTLCHRLGKGGMGTVYLAIDQSLNRFAAIKIFNPLVLQKFRDQVVREVVLAQRVTHINVCRIHDIKLQHEPAFLSMEYIDGEDLDQTLQRIGRFVPERALQISKEICRGLIAAHDEGIIHRDIKPRNIMLDSTGLVRITDFGLARMRHMDESGGIAGTLSHMAPEQLLGHGTSERSDIFSLGFVLHEVFTGRMPEPIKGGARSALAREWIPPSKWIPDLEPQTEKTILRCLQADPGARPQSVRSVLSSLEGSASERLSPIVSTATATSAEPVRWLSIVALVGLALCWLVTGFRPLEHVNFRRVDPDDFADFSRELIQELGYPAERRRGRQVDGFSYTASFRNRPEDAGQSICFWYRQADKPLVPSQLQLSRNQSPTRVSMHDPDWLTPGMLGVRLNSAGTLREFRGTPGGALSPMKDLEGQLASLFKAADLDPESFEREEVEPQFVDVSNRGFGPLRANIRFQPRLYGQAGPWVLVSTQGDRVCHFRVDESTVPAVNSSQFGKTMSDVLSLVVAIGGLVGLFMSRRNVMDRQIDSHSAKVTALIVFISLLCSALLSTNHTLNLHEEIKMFQFGLINALFWAAFLWLLYMSLEPFIERSYPRAMRDWILVTHGYFGEVGVALRIIAGAMLGVLATPLLAGAQMLIRDLSGLPERYGIPPIDLPAIEGSTGLAAVYCDALANSIYSAFALVLFPMLLNKIINHYRSALLLAWVINSIFYGSYFGGGIEPWWDWLLFCMYMSLWAGLHLAVAVRGGVLAAVSHLWVSSIVFFTPITVLSRWYRVDALIGTLMLAVAIVSYSAWVYRANRSKFMHA